MKITIQMKNILINSLIVCFVLGCNTEPKIKNNVTYTDLNVDSLMFSTYSQELIRKIIVNSYETENEFKQIYFRDNEYKLTVNQTYSYLINDEEIYSFLDWLTTNEGINNIHFNVPNPKKIVNEMLMWEISNFIPQETYIPKNKNLFFRLISRLKRQEYFLDFDKYIYDSKKGTDTIFKEQDRDFLFLQFVAIKDTIWYNTFSESELVTREEKLYIHYFSIPLFSIDKNYVIIELYYYCGTECAWGGYYVYRRLDNNNWKYITTVHQWES